MRHPVVRIAVESRTREICFHVHLASGHTIRASYGYLSQADTRGLRHYDRLIRAIQQGQYTVTALSACPGFIVNRASTENTSNEDS